MKKHLPNSLRALFLSLAVLLSLPMLAVEVEIDGINYDFNAEAKQATVIRKSNGEYSGEVVIPESVEHEGTAYSVTSIGNSAFYDCGLTSVTIPNSVTSIGDEAFVSCDGLTSVTIPNSVTSIGDGAFQWCTGLTSFTIPNSVTSIGEYAFYNCDGLTSVTIPNSVTSIGSWAFSVCSDLTSIVVEDENTVYDSRNNCNAIIETASNMLLCGCKTTIIPNSVTSIGDNAFYDCNGLTSVTIPNSVTSIGSRAFVSCDGLTSVTIPNSVTSIGEGAFWTCSGLTSVTIGNSVKSIGSSAFYYCSELTDVYCYAENVPSTESNAFEGLDLEFATLHVPDASVESYKTTSPWSSFGTIKAFPQAEINGVNYQLYPGFNLATVIAKSGDAKYSGDIEIPASVEYSGTTYSVTSIGDLAFYCCSGLTSVTIPNSVESIGSSAFYECYGLTSVTIGNSVTSIGYGAFFSCSGLTSVTIPNSVTSIGMYAFYYCTGLTSVTIPNSVTSIGGEAFRDCHKLTDVYCYAENVPSTHSYAFYDSNIENATLHVPAASIESYKETEPWNSFGTITSISGTVTLTDGEEFENNIEQEVATLTYTRTLSKTNTWNALYVPFEIPMTAEFCKNYDVAYFNDVHCYDNYVGEKENGVLGQDGVIDGMDMEVLKAQEGSVLNANYPYLIRAKNTDALNMNIKVEYATLYSAKETTISCSSVFMRFDVTGIYTTQTAGELKGEYDVYAISGGGWKQALNANQQLKPFRLYLKLTSIDGSPVKATEGAMSRINIRVQGEDTETGIDELKDENGKVKTEIFDLSGRRVQKAQKGIFIQNGKKVIM